LAGFLGTFLFGGSRAAGSSLGGNNDGRCVHVKFTGCLLTCLLASVTCTYTARCSLTDRDLFSQTYRVVGLAFLHSFAEFIVVQHLEPCHVIPWHTHKGISFGPRVAWQPTTQMCMYYCRWLVGWLENSRCIISAPSGKIKYQFEVGDHL
jgi:hypothetical protein